MDKHKYLMLNVYKNLENLNNGFDSQSVYYFSQSDFEIVLSRVENLGLGILGIEPWKNGEFFDVLTCEHFAKEPFDPTWYRTAFNKFIQLNEPLQYAASYLVSTDRIK